MKSFRLWLLVVLAVLLPVKAAMAAAMLCAPAGVGSQNEVRLALDAGSAGAAVETARLGHEHAGHDRSGYEHSGHEHGSVVADGDGPAGPHDKCNVCSAFCSVTPLVSALRADFTPPDRSAALFPELSAPPASFLSDGQDRPPRTL